MKKLLVASVLATLVSCGRPVPEQTSEQHLDIDIPKDEIDPNDLKELAGALNLFIVEGKSQVDFKALASQVNVTGDFKVLFDSLVESRDAIVNVECKGRKCVAKSTGKDFSFKPPVELPVVGKPTVILAKDITFYGELSEDLSRLEVCRIDGIKVKVSLFTQNVDGLLIETVTTPGKAPVEPIETPVEEGTPEISGLQTPAEGQAPIKNQDPLNDGSVTTVKTLKVDSGVGGSYPSKSCQW